MRLFLKNKKTVIYPIIAEKTNKKFHVLTYFGPISTKISNILCKDNGTVSFKSSNRLSNLIFNVKDKPNNYKKSGVYKLKCNECNGCYIGQTGRNFETRFKEHNACYRLKKRTSNFANHFLDTDHTFPDINNLQILHTGNKGRKLDILENIEIYKHKNDPNRNLLNTQIELGNSPLLKLLL